MSEIEERQAANVTPPEIGKIQAITLDTTSRRYDLGLLDLGGVAVLRGGYLYLSLVSTVAFYLAFNSSDAGTVDETAALAAGGTATFTSNGAWLVPANVEFVVRVHRTRHRYLVIKGSGAGIVRIRASSDSTGAGQ